MKSASCNMDVEKESLALRLQPYKGGVALGYSVLMWKVPLALALFCLGVNGVLLFGHFTESGVFAVVALSVLVVYSAVVVEDKFSVLSLFGVGEGCVNVDEDFDKACVLLASLKANVSMVLEYLLGSKLSGVVKIVYVSAVWMTIAFVFAIVGKFWIMLLLANAVILAPGLILNPEARENLQKKFEQPEKPKTE